MVGLLLPADTGVTRVYVITHDPCHSTLNTMAVGVRAATRPGIAATTLAKIDRAEGDEDHRHHGHGGVGHGVDITGERHPQLTPKDDASRHPDD